MKQLWDAVDFIRQTRRRLRFGELSRSPLRLLRLEVRGEEAECEWMARQPDVWDADLRSRTRNCNGSLQALQDALALRDLLFSEFPDIQTAELRAYRETDGGGARANYRRDGRRERTPPPKVFARWPCGQNCRDCGFGWTTEF